MSHIFALLSAIVFATCAAPHFVDARDHLSPHQRVILDSKSPPAAEYRFSFDLPAGPQFTEAEKEAQRAKGAQVVPRVRKAFESGADSVRISRAFSTCENFFRQMKLALVMFVE
jgi:hypothetical protein